METPSLQTGRVYKSTGSWYRVRTEDSGFLDCRIVGKMRLSGSKSTNPIAVGDWVDVSEQEDGTGIIHAVHERDNYVIRKSTKLSKQSHVLAANLDQVVVVTTIVQPRIALGLIDRVLVTAEAYGIPAAIVFNKFDLYDESAIDRLAEVMAIYDPVGYTCLFTSTITGKHIDQVEALFHGKTSLLTGHSGVGKSSLINAIDPSLELKIKDVSAYNEKGQHTTTFAEMHELSNGSYLIDTPGVRSFGVFDFEKEKLGHYFPEIRELMHDCRFHNCAHINEPGCAVKAAYEDGGLAAVRYESYLNLYHDEDLQVTFD